MSKEFNISRGTDVTEYSGVTQRMVGNSGSNVIGGSEVSQATFLPSFSGDLFGNRIGFGEGGLTSPVIGDMDGNRLTLDHEGIWRECKAEEQRQYGARRVENLISFSEDFSDPSWFKGNTATVTGNNVLNLPALNDFVRFAQARFIEQGNQFVFSVILSGSGTVTIRIDTAGGIFEFFQANVELTEAPTRYSIAATLIEPNHTAANCLIGRFSGATATEVKATAAQFELTTGSSKPTIPSEYVSTGILSSPFQGFNADGVQYFLTQNANTVLNNVVTEQLGNAISQDIWKGLFCEGEAENLALWSRDFTNAVWIKTNVTPALDAVGIDGRPNSASTLTATAANGTCFQLVTAVSTNYNTSFWVRRKTGTGTIEITDDGGTNYTDITSLINSSTYTQVQINRTQANPNIGFRIATSGDEIEVDFAGLVNNIAATSPIETDASTKTRLSDTDYTLDIANWPNPDNEISLKCKFTPFSNREQASSARIVAARTDGATRGITVSSAADQTIAIFDGVSTQAISSAWSEIGQTINVKVRAGGSEKGISIDASIPSTGSYAGTFSPSGAIAILQNFSLGACIKELEIYDTDLTNNWLVT